MAKLFVFVDFTNRTSFKLGTCEASRLEFESDDSDLIRFETDGPIRNFSINEIFESAAPTVVPQTTLTVKQKTSTVALL